MMSARFERILTGSMALLAMALVASMSTTSASAQSFIELLPPPPLLPYPPAALPELARLEFELPGDPASTSAEPIEESVVVEPDAEVVATPMGEELVLEEPAVEAPPWYHPSHWICPPGWDTAIEIGMNGSSGTSDSMSLRAGGYIKQETKSRKVKFDIYHNRTHASNVETQNNAKANYRYDWLHTESAWTLYVQNQLYYDKFQAFDLNVNLNSGFGYRFLDEEWIKLKGSIGSGASREFGGKDDAWVAEAQFGMDFEQHVSDTEKFYANVDYFPEWEQFGHFRMLTDMGWEVALQVPSNASLKFAATDRFDSHPDGVNPHNLNYSVVLLWKL